jgi:hypothetical protein
MPLIMPAKIGLAEGLMAIGQQGNSAAFEELF